jgi:site-specific DNA-methyltransferase (adenine-specific)
VTADNPAYPWYDQDGVRIYHGDCRDLLPTFDTGAFGVAFADPPYGVKMGYGDAYTDTGGKGYAAWMERTAAELQRVARVTFVTPGIRNIHLWPAPTWVLCWAKPGSTRHSDLGGFNEWEPILMYGKRLIRHDLRLLPSVANLANGDTGDHPCPKPLVLLRWLLAHTDGPVLDPFAGSGTTLRAAKDLGRDAVGIELEEHYCEIAAKRLAQGVLAL